MPELPEVETIRRGLLATVLGRRVESVEVLSKQSLAPPRPAFEGLIVGHRLAAVARRGKVLIIDLDSDAHLWVHLMMTGQLVVTEHGGTLFAGGHPSRSMLAPMPNMTTRVVFRLSGGRSLFFNDGRRLGRIKLLSTAELGADPFLARLGPEPLGDSFTLAGFTAAEVARALGAQGLFVWHGHFYALRLVERLGLLDRGGLVRVGLAPCNTSAEIERVIDAVAALAKAVR